MTKPVPYPYQAEDVANVIEAHKTTQRVIGRAATGLGKAMELAVLCEHYAQHGRVMVLVDVTKLVRQLAETIKWYTGFWPGIEMAWQKANNGEGFRGKDRIVVSTVQSQYSGDEGFERYRQFDPGEFSCLLLDECELFLAPKAREVVDWFVNGNPDIRVFGCTATPFRTDGVAMGDLFDTVAFDRDILWGIDNGWLVPARQAFVRVSLDFSTLKVRKGDDGERDYSDAEIAARIVNEQTLIELAKGIIHVAGPRKSIVVCPNVESCKAVCDYLNAEKPGIAQVIYGEMPDQEKDDAFANFRANKFQFLVSVMMLTKGFDEPEVAAVFNCRKTRSKRLYTQVLGRGTRPLAGLLPPLALGTPDERRAAIAASAKPDMLMVNMVGVEDAVRDITVVDILAGSASEKEVERAKRRMLEDGDAESFDAAEEIGEAKSDIAAEKERRARNLIKVQAKVAVEYQNDLRVGGSAGPTGAAVPGYMRSLKDRFKIKDKHLANMSAETLKKLNGILMMRAKAGLCTFNQAKTLEKHGYSKDQLRAMSKAEASSSIDRIAANGWKRPY